MEEFSEDRNDGRFDNGLPQPFTAADGEGFPCEAVKMRKWTGGFRRWFSHVFPNFTDMIRN